MQSKPVFQVTLKANGHVRNVVFTDKRRAERNVQSLAKRAGYEVSKVREMERMA